ncbi:MAG: thioredoxin domain-containing protein [Candidatus Zixiibacteriota bacterium]|nr:MAG: thioredoxin domain-containing protein [candidate division Zixibacteria bacterium]
MNDNKPPVSAGEGQTVAAPVENRNRLAHEQSPYLLQHADNPVDWYPWGEEAFERARLEDKPIFLSIGYSTCHWCHVMEEESFEDPEVARLMNETFICIKVDREERPDVDDLYMNACQMMTGSGGWPLTVILTPDRKPFFAGTYFPKESRYGRTGMLEMIPRLRDIWENRREDALRSAEQITQALQSGNTRLDSAGNLLDRRALDMAFEELSAGFDRRHGGFGRAPKFPTPHHTLFLLRYWKRSGDERALQMAEKTLEGMRLGGLYDHLGYGFHRYSTDARWLVPHFEKMLYDQALLAMAYVEAYQATGKSWYRDTAQEIFTYVLEDMTDVEGGFYSAEDADSEGKEGKFYLWTEEEIRRVLKPEKAELFVAAYNVTAEGNFVDPATGQATGENILHLARPLDQVALDLKMPEDDLRQTLDKARQKLFTAREQRIHPHKDDKVLTDWNGLMIAALAKGAQAFGDPKYSRMAAQAADFLLSNLRREDGRLLHRWRGGLAGISAHLDDYAFLIWGLIELYEATLDLGYLQEALRLNRDMLEQFWDEAEGGFFFTGKDAEELLVRRKEVYDGALPSGNSVALLNLLRLARFTADPGLEDHAQRLARTFARTVEQYPAGYTQMLCGVDFLEGPSLEVVISGRRDAEDTRAMLRAVQERFIPNKVLVHRPESKGLLDLVQLAPYTKDQVSREGRATAYVCRNYSCGLPTTSLEEMTALLAPEAEALP